MTRFLADENVDFQVVVHLRAQGYDVVSVAESCPSIQDAEVLTLALDLGAVLLTEDKDFGELVFRQRKLNAGVVLYRLPGLSSEEKLHRIAAAFATHADLFPGRFTVISPDYLRVRPNLSIS